MHCDGIHRAHNLKCLFTLEELPDLSGEPCLYVQLLKKTQTKRSHRLVYNYAKSLEAQHLPSPQKTCLLCNALSLYKTSVTLLSLLWRNPHVQ